MSKFLELRTAVQERVEHLFDLAKQGYGVLVYKHVENDEVWDKYLNGIPAEHNQIFRERRYYDGNYDKHFIRKLGGMVLVMDHSEQTIWDVSLPSDNFFADVCRELDYFVKSLPNRDYFAVMEKTAGHLANVDNYDPNITWEHFYAVVPARYVHANINEVQAKKLEHKQLLERAMKELSADAAQIVLDLINGDAIYRGAEHKETVERFLDLKVKYEKCVNVYTKDNWLWNEADRLGDKTRIRNSVIGTLVEDLTNGVSIERAVAAFEAKVAPTNYKRTTAAVSPMMVEKAKAKVVALGYEDSLSRRLATEADLPVEEMLFTATKHVATDAFVELSEEASRQVKTLGEYETITVDDFINKVLPRAKKVEVLKSKALAAKEFVFTAPLVADAPTMFKWDNAMAWTYLSDTTDAIKARVKEAGGDVDAYMRVSLSWHTPCDLDLHCHAPNGAHICFPRMARKAAGVELDLDMNGIDKHDPEHPVENIIAKEKEGLCRGKYKFVVNCYDRRSPKLDHFEIQTEVNGEIHTYRFDGTLDKNNYVQVLEFDTETEKFTVLTSRLKLQDAVSGNEFLPVKAILPSPNYWGGNATGNEHLMFVVDGFKPRTAVRGFFNEYLKSELNEHRKVFELLGDKLRIEPSEQSVGGYGVSRTSKEELIVRVTSTGKQVYKVTF